jgi:multidrug efflux system membrane fusion protein
MKDRTTRKVKKVKTKSDNFGRRRRMGVFILFLALGFLIFLLKIHYAKHPPSKPGPTVVVSAVQAKDVPVYIRALGNVVATSTITVKTQVNGLLMKVFYKEGQLVKAGDPLAEIDERPLLAQLTQYQGQLVRDQALLANALIDLKRYQRLWKQDSISQQTLATQEALVKQYQGAVETDEGLIASTKVNLIYCHIISPVDGRVGLRLVDPGNVVQTTDTTGLVVITSLSPITVIFTLAEDDVPRILPQVMANKAIEVKAYDRQQNKLLATGTLITMDNQIDPTTGTVKLRALFDNKDYALFSNQFVNIQLLVEQLPQAIVASTAAIQHGSNGDFVYVLNSNSTVTSKPVKTSITQGDETVIQEGLKAGERVVVEGTDRLTNGIRVNVASSR